MGFDCVFADVKVLTQLPVAHTSRQERQQFPLGVAHSAYSPTRGKREGGRPSKDRLPRARPGSELVVAARADKRTPGPPGQGRRTRGSTQRVASSTLSVSLRPRSTRNMAHSVLRPEADKSRQPWTARCSCRSDWRQWSLGCWQAEQAALAVAVSHLVIEAGRPRADGARVPGAPAR
jgi:hypothetical protein